MPIDVRNEKIITFHELARSLPRRRGNRPVHVSTVHRWRTRGLSGVRLEAVRVGGCWCTSWEAFRRFCDRLTAAHSSQGKEDAVAATSPRKSHRQADRVLEQEGW